jgi:hypothetical protein
MDTVKYILAKPDFIDGIGNVYPIKVSDYDEFIECSGVLNIRKEHFNEDAKPYQLLDLLIFGIGEKEKTVNSLEKLFALVTKRDVQYIENNEKYAFIIDEDHFITNANYGILRQTIMKQNLIFEQKIYKDPLVAEWAQKVLQQRSKGGVKITIEDMLSTVSVVASKSYSEIAEMTIYQMNADFKRITKDKDYHVAISMKCAGADKVNVNYFAEEINMFKNPYDDLFVSPDKLKNLNQAIKN